MAERCLLHRNKLDLFRWYLESLSYEIQPTKSHYEVLRAKKDKDTVIIFTRSNAEHLTVQDKDYEFVRRFLKQQQEIKKTKTPGGNDMNPILILGVLIAGFLLWLICSFLYRPIGSFFIRLFKDAEDAITKTDNKKNKRRKK